MNSRDSILQLSKQTIENDVMLTIEEIFLEAQADHYRREAKKLLAKAEGLDQQASLARRREALIKSRQSKTLLVFTKQRRHGVNMRHDLLTKIWSI